MSNKSRQRNQGSKRERERERERNDRKRTAKKLTNKKKHIYIGIELAEKSPDYGPDKPTDRTNYPTSDNNLTLSLARMTSHDVVNRSVLCQ